MKYRIVKRWVPKAGDQWQDSSGQWNGVPTNTSHVLDMLRTIRPKVRRPVPRKRA